MDKGNEDVEFPHEQKVFPSYYLLYFKTNTNYARDPFDENH
jgi:hypothetical protein